MYQSLILKPTKVCNADCSFCSSPTSDSLKWTLDQFSTILARLEGQLSENVVFIWHGGEPMLMGAEFYQKAFELVKATMPRAKFGLQTNLLLYSSKWRDVFKNVFEYQISTSYEPDETERTVNGSSENYNRVFKDKLEQYIQDGGSALLVGNYTEQSGKLAHKVYDWAQTFDGKVSFRVNHRRPSGRLKGQSPLITPRYYGEILVELFDRWCQDTPRFTIQPLYQMLEKTLGDNRGLCPWTKDCGGSFLAIEPNGDMYNCASMADLQDGSLCFGNIFTMEAAGARTPMKVVSQSTQDFNVRVQASLPMRKIKRRRVQMPEQCFSCRHFNECQGGCMKQAVEYHGDLYGLYPYCESWMMIFDHIKKSIMSGKCDNLLKVLNKDVEYAKNYVHQQLNIFNQIPIHMG